MNEVSQTISEETRLIKAVSTKPLGLRIREDVLMKNGPVCIYELSDGVIMNVHAALDGPYGFIPGPAPFASG